MTQHFYDADRARHLTRQVINGLPYGSYLLMSVGQLDGEVAGQFSQQYTAGQRFHQDRDTVNSFLHDLDVLEPGVTEARAWRLPVPARAGDRRGHIWAAVGRKTGGPPRPC